MSPPSRLRSAVSAVFAVFALALSASSLHADMAVLEPSKDNTIYSESDALSNGAGQFVFAGFTLLGDERCALLAFDPSSIPAGAVINSVSLTLALSMAPPGSGSTTMTLHRTLADWGEGASNAGLPGGSGAGALPGDATWLHTFSPSSFWATAGGDFVGGASASATVDGDSGIGNIQMWSSAGMVADVQAWIDNVVPNFGWILRGDEARRFNSRESGALLRPKLIVDFTVVPPPPPSIEAELLNNPGNDVRLSFPTITGFDYTLQTTTNLQNWADLTMTSGDDSAFEFDHLGGGADVRRYYRVVRTKV